jgi:hypothetical protein
MQEERSNLSIIENFMFDTHRNLKILWVENQSNVIDFWHLKWGK